MGCLGVKYLVLMVAEFWAVVGLEVRPNGFFGDGLAMGVLVVWRKFGGSWVVLWLAMMGGNDFVCWLFI